jgi:hypothetical protein
MPTTSRPADLDSYLAQVSTRPPLLDSDREVERAR